MVFKWGGLISEVAVRRVSTVYTTDIMYLNNIYKYSTITKLYCFCNNYIVEVHECLSDEKFTCYVLLFSIPCSIIRIFIFNLII